MKSEPWLTAKIDQVAADSEAQFQLAFHGDFYIEVDHETGAVCLHPRPEETSWES